MLEIVEAISVGTVRKVYCALPRDRHWLADVLGREALYLENGGRFYLDHGYHPEYPTPECCTPRQVAVYTLAGAMLLRFAGQGVGADRPKLQRLDLAEHEV